MKVASPEPAPHLSARSTALWRELVPSRARSAGRLVLLQSALEALDRADQAREVLDREGLTTTTKRSGVVHLHPLVRVEKDSRAQFRAAWSRLGLEWDPNIDGRTR